MIVQTYFHYHRHAKKQLYRNLFLTNVYAQLRHYPPIPPKIQFDLCYFWKLVIIS